MRTLIAVVALCLSFPVACQADQPVRVAAPGVQPAVARPVHGLPVHTRHHHGGGTCACGQVYQPVAPVVSTPVVSACGGCGYDAGCGTGCGTVCATGCGGGYGTGCGGCGSGLCNNWPEFYNRLYAEFYANNQWYVDAKKKENAARLARLRGLPEPEEVKAVK